MTGNPLELKIRLIIGKPLIINRVMTSFIVITFEIGQSAGKIPKSVMIRTWYSLNDVESNAKNNLKTLRHKY
jgi:hypothetical protein